MSKHEKLIQKILDGNSDITSGEAVKILKILGYSASPTGSSHLTFRKPNHMSVTLVITQNPVKPYIIAKLQEVLYIEGYKHE